MLFWRHISILAFADAFRLLVHPQELRYGMRGSRLMLCYQELEPISQGLSALENTRDGEPTHS